MKQIILLVLVLFLTACSANQPILTTSTSTATTIPPTHIPPTAAPKPPTETPIVPTPTEKIKSFNVCATREQAKDCVITQADFDSGAFFKSIVAQDKGGFDKDKVVFYPLQEVRMGEFGSFINFISDIPGLPDIRELYKDPKARFSRELGWGFIEIDSVNHYGFPVAVFEYLNPDGTTVRMQGITGGEVKYLESKEIILPYIVLESCILQFQGVFRYKYA